jgi:CheY-like chemotaxis protein
VNFVSKHIVIVDDDKFMRKIVCHYVNEMGHKVSEARNGSEYLELSKNQDVDLVLLDILMPEMDGATLLHKLVENDAREAILLVSSKDESFISGTLRIVTNKGLNLCGSLKKPFDQNDLVNKINEALAIS